MNKKRLSIIIVNYKTPQLTIDCINTLKDQLDHQRDHIVIVDNNSGGDDVTILSQWIENSNSSDYITLIPAPENGGFSYGNNIGIKAVEAEYYLLANADTLFRPNSIESLISATEKYPEAGMISCRLEFLDGEPQISTFNFHTPFSEMIDSANTSVITRMLNSYIVPQENSSEVTYPQWVAFACVLIKDEVFEKIGYLDEDFFMYYEDVDFCRRATNANFPIVCWPHAHVVHLQGQSSGVNKPGTENKRLPSYYYQSRTLYYRKNYGVLGPFIANVFWHLGRSISLLRELLFSKSRSLPKYQHIDIWKR